MSATGQGITAVEIPTAFANRVSLSRAEVAETLGCSRAFVDTLIADGKLGSSRVRCKVFIVAQDVWALMGLAAAPIASSSRARAILRRVAG